MAEHSQSFKNLFRDFMVNLFSGLLGGAVIGILSGRLWLGILIFGLLLIASMVYLVSKKYKRLFKLMKAGATGYYYTFDLSENRKVFEEIKNSFYYLGISANSIIEFFRGWLSKNPSINEYLFLLMDPESSILKRQIAHEKGLSFDTDLSSINIQLFQAIEHELETEKERIYSAIELLKNLSAFKEGKLRIRLYSEFIPWWMYIIDDRKIYLGILERGKRGQESPVMVISKHPNFTSPFDAFKNTWDRMWADAREV